MQQSSSRPIYFDCDTGIDDALALVYLANSPEINLVGIGTVCGNTYVDQAAENTLRLLALLDIKNVPVARGEMRFLTHKCIKPPTEIHGENGLGNIELPETELRTDKRSAAQLLVDLAIEYAGLLEIIAVGPLTNLAKALKLDPDLPKRVKKITIMGGSAQVAGNVSAVAEANIWNDPEAANIVLHAEWSVTLVGLDVTLQNVLEEQQRVALLNSGLPVARILGEILDFYFDFYALQYGRRCAALHDPLAAAIAVGTIKPVNSPWVEVVVDDTDGPGRGQTIADLRGQLGGIKNQVGAHTRMVLATDKPLAEHLLARILGTD